MGMRYQRETKIKYRHKMEYCKEEDISEKIIKRIVQNYLNHKCCFSSLVDLKNILPLYLICGFIYLKRYLKNMKNRLKDSVLTKIFLTCCWIAIKNFNGSYVASQDFLDNYKCNNKEIIFIEAHLLSKINYNIDITQLEIMNWDID